jgi:membrane-bound serine protease (ClpP class)
MTFSNRVLTAAVRLCLLLGVGILALVPDTARNQTSPADQQYGLALRADIDGVIGPATTKFLKEALTTAQEREAEILILQINTPGGLATSMRDMIIDILAAPLPVIGFVAPAGARAASAGTYIIYATHVAAMAPGTNLGAATPVQIGGGVPGMPKPGGSKKKEEKEESSDAEISDDSDKKGSKADANADTGESADKGKDAVPDNAMKLKTVNDAVAFIRSLAELRGRNAEWAEKAVRQADSLSAAGALDERVIDLLADDIRDLLEKLDGRTVTVAGEDRILSTRTLLVEQAKPSVTTRLLSIISNPNIALILMLIGVYGLIFELANPGSIGPGIVGVICLVLGLYALNQLPLDYAGLALLFLGVALMVVEAITPTVGVIGLGGVVSFVIGAAMLIDTDVPEYQVTWTVIAAMAAISSALLVLLLGYVTRSLRRPVASGEAALVGTSAEVLEWHGNEGHVWSAGERWQARSKSSFRKGDTVSIEGHEGLTLIVKHRSGNRQGGRAKRNKKGD